MDDAKFDDLLKKGLASDSTPNVNVQAILKNRVKSNKIYFLIPFLIAGVGLIFTATPIFDGLSISYKDYFTLDLPPSMMIIMWCMLLFLSLDLYVKRFR
ncbi:MAG: hypothetical protein Kapaf2KO_18700 [Candidatus Kapaibacteriales bacterium]